MKTKPSTPHILAVYSIRCLEDLLLSSCCLLISVQVIPEAPAHYLTGVLDSVDSVLRAFVIIASPVEMKLLQTVLSRNRSSSQGWLERKNRIIKDAIREFQFLLFFLTLQISAMKSTKT